MKNDCIFCLVGPSGSGKSTIAKELPLESIKCYTTREPRVGEFDGDEKYFISEEEFLTIYEQMIAHTKYGNHFYGITQGELFELENGPLSYVVDWKGAEGLKKTLPHLVGYEDVKIITIFIEVPKESIEMRMIAQGRSEEEIKTRLHRYGIDNKQRVNCDYIVQNNFGKLNETIEAINKIVDFHLEL